MANNIKENTMNSMLHIGNGDEHESATATASAIVAIFQGAREHTMDQSTVVSALEAFCKVAEVKNVAVSNCVFTNNPNTATEAQSADEPDKNEEDEYED